MIKKLLSSQLRINMVSGTVTTAVNIVILAVGYPIYLHFLGYERYGVWLVLTTVLTFARLGNLGIDRAVIKLVAEEYGRGDVVGIERYLMAAISILVLTGSLVLLLILLFKGQIVDLFGLSGENRKMVLGLLPYVGCLSVYVYVVQAVNAGVSGLGRMDLANYVLTAGRAVKVLVASILLYRGRGIESLLIANTLSYLAIHALSVVLMRRIMPLRLIRLVNLRRGCYRRLLSFGGGILGGSLASMLFSPFNKLILARYVGVDTVPIYDMAYTSSMTVRMFIEAGLRALMPEISRMDAEKSLAARRRISSIYARSMRLVFSLGTPLYLLLMAFAPLLLQIWLRDKFIDTLPGTFRIMLIGTYFSLLGVPAYHTLMGTGYIRYTLGAHLVQTIVNMALVFALVAISWVTTTTIGSACALAMATATGYLTLQHRRIDRQIGDRSSHNVSRQEGATVPA